MQGFKEEAAITTPVLAEGERVEKEYSDEYIHALQQQRKREDKFRRSIDIQGRQGIGPDAKQMFKIRKMMNRETVDVNGLHVS